MRRTRCFAIVVVLALSAAGLLGAQDSANSRRFEKLGHGLICTCGCNQVLLECNHVGCPASSGMRDELAAALAKDTAGDNDAVLQTFVTKYGPTVLAAPTTTGFNRVAWIMPFAVFVTGIMAVVMITRVWKQRSIPSPAHPARLPDDLRARIRQETEE
ncbi:MAG TPA: cytochrome c-type biogenesis protein CcmH [Terriglobales bacterium]|nr:cytochrome c-type biogenesis protein CcmH [Terriglobales bacterium]